MLLVDHEVRKPLHGEGNKEHFAFICFAHVTNHMARIEGDFEKGTADGTTDALRLILATARRIGPEVI